MLTILNLFEEEIQRLNYERFHYPCAKVQKRLHTICLKAAQGHTNRETGSILDIHYNTVPVYIKNMKKRGWKDFIALTIIVRVARWENISIP